MTLGALVRFPKRVILGVSFRTQKSYLDTQGEVFHHPWQASLGLGQIINRFFRYELGVRLLGPNVPNDGIYGDQSRHQLQPHAGFEYEIANLRKRKVKLNAGT